MYDIDYIRNYMNELDKVTKFNSSDIVININNRLTSSYGVTYFDRVKNEEGKSVLKATRIDIAKYIMDSDISENKLRQLIGHEYCHAWADNNREHSYGHCGLFVEYCKKINAIYVAKIDDPELNKIYFDHLIKLHSFDKTNIPKSIREILKTTRYASDIRIRIVKDKGEEDMYNITLSNNYADCTDLDFVFFTAYDNIINLLNKQDYISDIREIDRIKNEKIRLSIKVDLKAIEEDRITVIRDRSNLIINSPK